MANTLEEGAAWCEARIGITPGPGGKHALMGTHNRLIRINSPENPTAYLEIIAIDSEATHATISETDGQSALKPSQRGPFAWHRTRWFDMDDPALRERVKTQGPQLIHWVAAVPDVQAALQALQALGIDRGPALKASRMTPQGLLEWQITVREDGQRLFNGCLPTLIQWGQTHPTQTMSDSGVTLKNLSLQHPEANTLHAALQAVGLHQIQVTPGPAQITAKLGTSDGYAELNSER
jgi:Glyoxalase-like domain